MSLADSIYQFHVPTSSGEEKSLADYRVKVVLIVNTAGKCGFTPQYEGLQSLYDQYAERGLEIIAMPCNPVWRTRAGHKCRSARVFAS